MVPDKFNMVDMEGIDIITSQGEEIPGLYQKLVESIAQCRYQCIYNWKFDGILIPPTYVEMTIIDDVVWINEGVSVDEEDIIRVYSLEPPAPEPNILELSVTENGTYVVPEGVDGFNPVSVSVPATSPVIEPISITQNGITVAPSGVDGYSPITVNVQGGATPKLYWDFTQSLVDSIEGLTASLAGGASLTSDGVLLQSAASIIKFPSALKNYPFFDFEVEFGEINAVLASSHMRLFMFGNSAGLIYRNIGVWSFYSYSAWATNSDITDVNFFSNSILRVEIGYDNKWKIYKNGSLVYSPDAAQGATNPISIGAADQSFFPAVIKSFKVY